MGTVAVNATSDNFGTHVTVVLVSDCPTGCHAQQLVVGGVSGGAIPPASHSALASPITTCYRSPQDKGSAEAIGLASSCWLSGKVLSCGSSSEVVCAVARPVGWGKCRAQWLYRNSWARWYVEHDTADNLLEGVQGRQCAGKC